MICAPPPHPLPFFSPMHPPPPSTSLSFSPYTPTHPPPPPTPTPVWWKQSCSTAGCGTAEALQGVLGGPEGQAAPSHWRGEPNCKYEGLSSRLLSLHVCELKKKKKDRMHPTYSLSLHFAVLFLCLHLSFPLDILSHFL